MILISTYELSNIIEDGSHLLLYPSIDHLEPRALEEVFVPTFQTSQKELLVCHISPIVEDHRRVQRVLHMYYNELQCITQHVH